MPVDPLGPEALTNRYGPEHFGFDTTAEIDPLEGIIGQERAVRALKFGLDMRDDGYNIYVAGWRGTGKDTAVKSFLQAVARQRPPADDWCYVNNFDDPYRPSVLRLPQGKGHQFRQDMKDLTATARREVSEALESDAYNAKHRRAIEDAEARRQELLTRAEKQAGERGFVLQASRTGIQLVPMLRGKPMNDEEISTMLDAEERRQLRDRRREVETEIREQLRELGEVERQTRKRLAELRRNLIEYAVGGLIEEVKDRYAEHEEVVGYLEDVAEDLVENVSFFQPEDQGDAQNLPPQLQRLLAAQNDNGQRYEVNVLIDHTDAEGAPVIIESNPSHPNLLGRIEKEVQMGAMRTDFTMIQAGALHRANGGFLVIPVNELLRNPLSLEALKRALRTGCVDIEDVGERFGFVSTKTLRPEPVPLEIKVILVGNPTIYRLLSAYDEEFGELFRVKAEFDTEMDRTDENVQEFVNVIGTLCNREDLCHLDGTACARIVEHASRVAENKQKLTTRFSEMADILREAAYWAAQEDKGLVSRRHVQKAIEEKAYRLNLVEERIRELIAAGTIKIDVSETRAGVVNGLAVLSLGDYRFGRPSRISATVAMGTGGVIDIEREARLGGQIHTKGVLILSGYLARRFAQRFPLTLSARLVFEQSYGMVDGDSASVTELFALLSALAGVPVRQGIAVTGSVNQQGEVQAIGGVNEKIEGYFEVCRQLGFTAGQGVLIPKSNVRNLMLREDVVQACEQGTFSVYAIETVAQGIELLTGMPAGERAEDGLYAAGSLFRRVEDRLEALSKGIREFRPGLGAGGASTAPPQTIDEEEPTKE